MRKVSFSRCLCIYNAELFLEGRVHGAMRSRSLRNGVDGVCTPRVTSFPDIGYPSVGVSRIAQTCISLEMSRTYDFTARKSRTTDSCFQRLSQTLFVNGLISLMDDFHFIGHPFISRYPIERSLVKLLLQVPEYLSYQRASADAAINRELYERRFCRRIRGCKFRRSALPIRRKRAKHAH